MRHIGVTARGVIAPIFKSGDDLAAGVLKSVLEASKAEGFPIEDGDVVGITESVLARTQGNYAEVTQIAADIRSKFGGGDLGLVFPIMSRNRFSVLLRGIAMGCDKLYILLSYPRDEVGNQLVPQDIFDETGVNPFSQHFGEKDFYDTFGKNLHPFTGVDYIEFYKTFGEHIEIVFSNDPAHILKYTKNVLCCDIHSRNRTARIVKNGGAQKVYTLTDILTESVDGSGFNEEYGLLGSNMASDTRVKLFPRKSGEFALRVQESFLRETGRKVEAIVYGDGCFMDPIGGIWELADPVASPGFTPGLLGTPSEIKIKYFADNDLSGLSGGELEQAMKRQIRGKADNLVGAMAAQGTTPRRYCDLVASLCDLVGGSGDRGTPVIYIKGYYTNYATE